MKDPTRVSFFGRFRPHTKRLIWSEFKPLTKADGVIVVPPRLTIRPFWMRFQRRLKAVISSRQKKTLITHGNEK